jgi:UPF0755 protein
MLLVLVMGLAAAAYGVYREFQRWSETPPAGPGRSIRVELPRGASARRIALLLEKAGLVDSARRFELLIRLEEAGARLKAGEYEVVAPVAPRELLDLLVRGKVALQAVTIPEGLTMVQIAKRLEREGLVSREGFLAACRSPELLRSFGIAASTAEGYLFPETYHFEMRVTAAAVVRAMLAMFRRQVGEDYAVRAEAVGLNEHEAVTLASLVEKETALREEMPLVSAVYHNRLRRGMLLQADPTVIYALPDFDGRLLTRDLSYDSPYNTYLYPGLPPGPIANPGLAALEAAVAPADVRYLYFVARGDGSHVFSRTLAEHNRAVAAYRRTMRARRRARNP